MKIKEKIVNYHIDRILDGGKETNRHLIYFLDTHELDIVPVGYFSDISWSDRGRKWETITNYEELESLLFDNENITEKDLNYLVEYIIENHDKRELVI